MSKSNKQIFAHILSATTGTFTLCGHTQFYVVLYGAPIITPNLYGAVIMNDNKLVYGAILLTHVF